MRAHPDDRAPPCIVMRQCGDWRRWLPLRFPFRSLFGEITITAQFCADPAPLYYYRLTTVTAARAPYASVCRTIL